MIYDLQKAGIWKRIAAFLLDLILIVVVATGVLTLLSWATGYDKYLDTYMGRMQAIEEEHGLVEAEVLEKDVHLADLYGTENYEKLSEEKKALFDQAWQAFQKDQEAIAAYNMMTSLLMLFTSIPILIAYIAVEFIVPLIFKNGQTLGKKVFGIAVVRVDCIKVTPLQMFVRTILGKYTVEAMVPLLLIVLYGWVGLVVLAGIAVLEVVVMVVSKNNSLIHDLLAGTVAVDLASQMIFESPEALLEYKKKLQAQAAADSQYP